MRYAVYLELYFRVIICLVVLVRKSGSSGIKKKKRAFTLVCRAAPWLRRVVICFLTRSPGFDPRSFDVRLVAYKVAMGQGFFFPSSLLFLCWCHPTNAPYSLSTLCSY